MRKFFAPASTAKPKVAAPRLYTASVADCADQKRSLVNRWPHWSAARKRHQSFDKFDNDYGWAGTLYAKLHHREKTPRQLKEDFDKAWMLNVSLGKNGPSKRRAARLEAYRSELYSCYATRVRELELKLKADFSAVIVNAKVSSHI